MNAPARSQNAGPVDAEFDDVMLAMDVVDTLRYRDRLVERDLGAEAREDALVERLRVIYKNQGIDVPDRILRDGVRALEEERFVYEPPKGGFMINLARAYVARDRWLKPVAALIGVAAFVASVYQFGYAAPRAAAERRAHIEISQTLPQALTTERDAAIAAAETEPAQRYVNAIFDEGTDALETENADTARAAIDALQTTTEDLQRALTVRIISRPGEMSGVFRVHDADQDVRNYYLIVEAVDARGRVHPLPIFSEETQQFTRVSKWGVRVSEGEFNRVAADKQDDQIIQNAIIGEKSRGALSPEYSIDTLGGAIVEW